MATTAREVVVEPVRRELSRTRMTSPPMLLGRKLLKNWATRYDPDSWASGAVYPWASSSTRHRHVDMARMPA